MHLGEKEVIGSGKHKAMIRNCWAGTEVPLHCPVQGKRVPWLKGMQALEMGWNRDEGQVGKETAMEMLMEM